MKLTELKNDDFVYNENNGIVLEAEEYKEMDTIEGLELYKATEKKISLVKNAEALILDLLVSIEGTYDGFVEDALFLLSDETKELFKSALKSMERDLPPVFDIDIENKIEI